jgi:Cu+-exporting ATPase
MQQHTQFDREPEMESSFDIRNIDSPEAIRLLSNALQDLPGITHIDISTTRQTVTVEHGRLLSAEDIQQAISDAGFGVDDATY